MHSILPTDGSAQDQVTDVQEYDWRVVRVFPHDTTAFTQGLIFRDGYLYESTGRKGHSGIRKVRLETGEIIQQQPIGDEYFGEGLTAWNDHLIQLTLSSGTGFVYDVHTFERLRDFEINGEGWGLTTNGDEFIISDGSSNLRVLNAETFLEIRQVRVKHNGELVSGLNELEMIDGKIFANKLFSDEILMIDPISGEVIGIIDLERLVTGVKAKNSVSVLNGIAYDSESGRIFVTGKLWPTIFEIEIWPRDSD
ncbi:MAG: glutaminyl-peptide cyclotransferase [Balneolaceae bacterium]|nr:glutaminyl-peptide cyclotransferase [Balneolaceae bacterium]MDR9407551.1 glutaminyl-peptide cyclotransferase [Balneolaceae bacterium]